MKAFMFFATFLGLVLTFAVNGSAAEGLQLDFDSLLFEDCSYSISVTAYYSGKDVSDSCQWESRDNTVAVVHESLDNSKLIMPVSKGKTTLLVRYGDYSIEIPIEVKADNILPMDSGFERKHIIFTLNSVFMHINSLPRMENDLLTIEGGFQKEIYTGSGIKPQIQNGRTLLPIRALAEEFGGEVDWDAYEKKITIRLNDNTIYLWIDNDTAYVNGEKYDLDVAPQIINSRTFVPLRFVAEYSGLRVDWDSKNRLIWVYNYFN